MSITLEGVQIKKFNFPVGEPHAQVTKFYGKTINITWNFEDVSEFFDLALIIGAVYGAGRRVDILEIPYLPFSRQDRICNLGDSPSLSIFEGMLHSVTEGKVKKIITWDLHELKTAYSSDSPYLQNKCVQLVDRNSEEDSTVFIKETRIRVLIDKDTTVVFCDETANKRLEDTRGGVNRASIWFKKCRNESGDVNDITHLKGDINTNKKYIIVDDICDGGRTFIETAKKLKELHNNEDIDLQMYVTHGFFTKGLDVFKGYINKIYTPTQEIEIK